MGRFKRVDGVLIPFTAEEEAAADAAAAITPRPLIRKSVVQERVNSLGKLGVAFTALQAQPILFGRWFAPDYPNVYADDADLLALLSGIGCTEAEIAIVTAT